MINTLNAVVEKVKKMHNQMWNFSREMKILKENQTEKYHKRVNEDVEIIRLRKQRIFNMFE